VALELAGRGWNIALGYLQCDAAAEEVASAIRKAGGRVILYSGNLANPENCAGLIAKVSQEAGRLNGIVHCAALGSPSATLATRSSRWELTWNTHVGAFLEILAHARPLLAPGAGVVALSSLGAHRVMGGYGPIAAAKGALESLVRYLAAELAGDGIHVNAVCGGPIDTDSLRVFPGYKTLVRESGERPAGRMGRPQDLAPVIAFLLSPEAYWIRGQVIVADGGFGLY
jgi:enoyl-[acyl-carrier protein] reductase III